MSTRARGTTRECPTETPHGPCKARVAGDRPCCVTHWRQAPVGLRTAFLQAWGRWQRTHLDAEWDALIDARAALLEAVSAPRP